MHMISTFLLTADVVSSSSWLIIFNVQTLKVAMMKVFLPLSKFGLGSVSGFLNTKLQPQQNIPLVNRHEGQCSWDVWFEFESFWWLYFQINICHSYKFAVVCS